MIKANYAVEDDLKRGTRHRAKVVSVVLGLLALWMLSAVAQASANKPLFTPESINGLSDEELSGISGQALFVTNRIAGDGSTALGTAGITFFRAGLDASLDLNLNIEKLELGRTGPGLAGVDILADNVALGCVANTAGTCTPSGTVLKPINLLRPFLEFAVENEASITGRKVVGIRLGAENFRGPLSFGLMQVFSGFLNAKANLTLQGMTDVAATCGPANPPCPGSIGGGADGQGRNIFGFNAPTRSLGLANQQICSGLVCAEAANITVNFNGASANNLDAVANGKRLTQASVLNPGLATLIDTAVNSLTINRCEDDFFACTGGSLFPGLIRPAAAQAFKDQVCAGLGITNCTNANLNTTPLPFNLTNFHQVDVNSSNIGLSFQSRTLRFPGFLGNVQEGWALHLPDAFTLNVAQPAAVFTFNIANGAAGQGDLVALPPVLDNCFGPATFC